MASKRKACATCILAKTKCVMEDSERCERCLRLNKVCAQEMDEEVLLRKKIRKSVRSSQKINLNLRTPPSLPLELTSQTKSSIDILDATTIHDRHDRWLELYKKQMTQNFPFVVVPAQVSATDLHNQQPILFNAIMMAACDEPVEQISSAKQLREEIAQSILVEGQRSIDLLQAILIAIAWYHVHLDVNLQLSNLLAVGTAMLTDLGLASHPQQKDRRKSKLGTDETPVFQENGHERSLEHRRIFLGYCYLGTFIFITCERVQCIKNMAYQDQCVEVLDIAKEYQTDTYLTYLSRLTKLAQTMTFSLDMEEFLPAIPPSRQDWDVIEYLRSELSEFRLIQSGSENTTSSQAVAHVELVELYLEELKCYMLRRHHDNVKSTQYYHNHINKCYKIAKSLLEQSQHLITGPPSSWTYPEFLHSIHSIVVLLQTAGGKDDYGDQWQHEESPAYILQMMEMNLLDAGKANATCVSGNHNIYNRAARQIRILRERYTSQKRNDTIQPPHIDREEATDTSVEYPSNMEYNTEPALDDSMMTQDAFWYTDLGPLNLGLL